MGETQGVVGSAETGSPSRGTLALREASTTSLIAVAIALPMIRRTVSPIPIGRTPGHLSRAMRQQAQIRLAVEAKESHKSADAVLKEVRRRVHAAASKPEGPACGSVHSEGCAADQ